MVNKQLCLMYAGLILLLASNAEASSFMTNLHTSFIAGYGYTWLGGAQNVWLANSPDPGLENTFTSGGQQHGTFLLGLALEETVNTYKNIESAVGVELDFLRNSNLSGVVQPMVNVAPDFDRLNYTFDLSSYLALVTAKVSMPNIFHQLGVFIQAGAGGTINQFANYTETSPTGSSAAPMLAPFGDDYNSSFAYSLGAGFSWQSSGGTRVLIGYRYINTKLGGFKTSPVQQTENKLQFSPLSQHFITLNVNV